ncbi:MAG: metal-dependent hydrolase [Dokdonella sp.]
MDSLTQILLGGSVAALAVPATHRRRALLVGAVLGTLPDLDVIPLALLGLDPIDNMTWHRGPSHSLPVLGVVGWLIWWLLRRVWSPVRDAPRAWLLAIQLSLLTHPLLDAFTVYGTQLLWPLPMSPVMWSSIFIIDPLYTVPLLVGFVAAIILGGRARARPFLLVGLALSSAYLCWSLVAKAIVERSVDESLAREGLQGAAWFSVPMPFNTLLWRVVIVTGDGFLEGERSLVADRGPLHLRAYPRDGELLGEVGHIPAIARLHWFARGFVKADQRGQQLVISDLRMGAEPDYTFSFVVAEQQGDVWRAIRPVQIAMQADIDARLAAMWQRIWVEPRAAELPAPQG